MRALIFDCDGVLVDTERDGHRVAFNEAFTQSGLDIQWDATLYGQLLKVAGGKERMRYYFDNHGWPSEVTDRDEFIKKLHADKTDRFMQIIQSERLPLRSGVTRLIDEAIEAHIKLAVCSTSNERAVMLIVEKLLGADRRAKFNEILAGDIVSKKKPDPEIYHLAQQRLGVNPHDCVVVEDSRNGLLAATRAGMHCLVTTSAYTANEDFIQADRVVSDLGDTPGEMVTLSQLIPWTKKPAK